MKNLIAVFLFIVLLPNALMANTQLARFSMEKSIFDGMSDSQKNALITKTGELGTFIEEEIKPKIPSNVLASIKELKIKILFTDAPGRDGLFIPEENTEHTIKIQLNQLHSNGLKALLAHEIFHAIHYHLNADELPWMREGLAQLFEYIITGELNGMNLRAAVLTPVTPLLGDYHVQETSAALYGHGMLYFYYLYNQCGGNNLFWNLTTGSNIALKGSLLIDHVLAQQKIEKIQCADFEESAISFEAARMHNKTQYLKNDEKNRFYVLSLDIVPAMAQFKTKQELNAAIIAMPALSSMRMPLAEFEKLQGTCEKCSLFYAQSGFPYSVSESRPAKSQDIVIILVKLQKD